MKNRRMIFGLCILASFWIEGKVYGQGNEDTIRCRSLWEEIHNEMGEAFNEIDWEKLRKEMQEARAEALEAVKWDEIREDMDEVHDEIKRKLEETEWEAIKRELEKEMKDVKTVLDSLYREVEREFRKEGE